MFRTRSRRAVDQFRGEADISFPGELRLPLLIVGTQPFLRVIALEKLLLQFALDGQRALDRDFPSRLHGPLDPADRFGRLVRRAETQGVLHDTIPPLPAAL